MNSGRLGLRTTRSRLSKAGSQAAGRNIERDQGFYTFNLLTLVRFVLRRRHWGLLTRLLKKLHGEEEASFNFLPLSTATGLCVE